MNETTNVTTVWECWSYDVWGNENDGFEVNDRSCFDRSLILELDVETCNAGTPHEFVCAHPSDEQIRDVWGKSCEDDGQGDDRHCYIASKKNGRPIGEMICVSHDSLSPIGKMLPAWEGVTAE